MVICSSPQALEKSGVKRRLPRQAKCFGGYRFDDIEGIDDDLLLTSVESSSNEDSMHQKPLRFRG